MEVKLEKRNNKLITVLDFSKDEQVDELYKKMILEQYKNLLKTEVEIRD